MRARTDFAGYQLGEPFARSGLAMIFRATDPVTGVEFALKVIQPPFGTQPEDLSRFVAETRAATGLDHPHCVRVFGAGVEEGFAWVAMELLTGGSLTGRLAAVERMAEAAMLTVALQAASALAAAQAAGLTHHDIEPNNLVFDEGGVLKVTDFGQAVFYERASHDVGIIWGQPCFVAPERLARAEEDALTDIYGLGATLFRALTGEPPYGGEAHGQILFDRMGNETIRIENHVRPIHASTAAVLNRMLAASRARRFQSWKEVIEHLCRAHSDVTGRTSPPAPPESPPVRAPAPRITPSDPALPLRKPAVAKTATRVSWLTLLIVVAMLSLIGWAVWKYRFAPRVDSAAPAKLEGVALPPAIPVGFVVWPNKKERMASATF